MDYRSAEGPGLACSDKAAIMEPKKLLYFVTEDWYFCSHRLELAVAAMNSGYDVSVVTRVSEHAQKIRNAGLRLIPFENSRGGINPFVEFMTLVRLIRIYRRERPDLVHHVAMKPVFYGSIAARLTRVPAVVNAITGMGWLFSSNSDLVRKMVQNLVRSVFTRLLGRGETIVQNPDDAEMLVRMGLGSSRLTQIPGSGVDLTKFRPAPKSDGVVTVVLSARLLWEKGVREFVEAAALLKQRGCNARLVIAGVPDELNRAAVSPEDLSGWVRGGLVEHLGWVDDVAELLTAAHIVCLPSYYREGMPKSLLEAAAAGLPIVTADTPGCREVVRDKYNGLLVPPRSGLAVADALEELINNREVREEMGRNGRIRAEREFGIESIVRQTLAVYEGAVG
jgi:glycosyltransferase involved in cell wall biosynthesis